MSHKFETIVPLTAAALQGLLASESGIRPKNQQEINVIARQAVDIAVAAADAIHEYKDTTR
jgi:hypothetical protein